VVVFSTLTALGGSLTNLLNLIRALRPPQPVIGFPLRPTAVQQQPFVTGVTVALDSRTAEHVARISGADLGQAEVVFSLNGTVVQQVPLTPTGGVPFPGGLEYEARLPNNALLSGSYEVFVTRDGGSWLIEDAYVVP
jgi:hypothetical protein